MVQAVVSISAAQPRIIQRVRGVVESVLLQPKSAAPTFEVVLRDTSGYVSLRWDGQRSIEGIEVGVILEIEGTPEETSHADMLTIHSPKYTIT